MTNALEVDCTQVVVNILAAPEFARIVTELPDKLEASVPVVQVVRVGGPDDGVVLDQPTFILHGFAPKDPAGQKAANALLDHALSLLRAARGSIVVVDGGRAVVTRVRKVGGPSVAAYENPLLRHAVTTVEAGIKIA